MKSKLFKSGDDIVVSLPIDLLERYGLSEGSEVEVTESPLGLFITPAGTRNAGVDPDFERHVAEFIEKYRSALESLADR